jgi:hypothetical protein
MPTVQQTVDEFSRLTGATRTRVNQIARRLIDDGQLPKSAGKDIKEVNPADAMLLLFAIPLTDRVADAPSVAKAFAELPHQGQKSVLDPTQMAGKSRVRKIVMPSADRTAAKLASVVGELLAPSSDQRCKQLNLSRDAHGQLSAEIKLQGPAGFETSVYFHHDGDVSASSRQTFTLTSEGFEALRDFLEPDSKVHET